MTTTEAMKHLICYIKNDGTTVDEIAQTNAADLWEQIGIAFNARFNNGSESGSTSEIGELGGLTLVSSRGETVGTTTIQVTGASGTSFKYAVDGAPEYHENLSTWADWDGTSDIVVEDGAHICVAEVDANGLAVKAGYVTANVNLDQF